MCARTRATRTSCDIIYILLLCDEVWYARAHSCAANQNPLKIVIQYDNPCNVNLSLCFLLKMISGSLPAVCAPISAKNYILFLSVLPCPIHAFAIAVLLCGYSLALASASASTRMDSIRWKTIGRFAGRKFAIGRCSHIRSFTQLCRIKFFVIVISHT